MIRNYLALRRKYPEFIYKGFDFDFLKANLNVKFYYEIPKDHSFTHVIKLKNVSQNPDVESLKTILFNIGLCEMFSYWKVSASPRIVIKEGKLDDFQKIWWLKLLKKGMGQYFYENAIDFAAKDFVEILCLDSSRKETPLPVVEGDRILIPVGEGKDSVVTLELFSQTNYELGAFVVNANQASLEIIKKVGIQNLIEVERNIDKKVIYLNNEGYLNGHVPFSASLAFIGTLAASLLGYKHLAFSNEKSSDEENTEYFGEKINHQYSKTSEFEKDFIKYNQKYLTNVNYFSFLRPIYDLQICKIFSRYDKYFQIIRSCNVGKGSYWCCSCPKCLSTFILLYPFLGPEKIEKVFPRNLFEDNSLKNLLLGLIDKDSLKPFECVGTREELVVAMYLSFIRNRVDKSHLLEFANKAILEKEQNLELRTKNILEYWGEHNLPLDFEQILKKAL